MASAHGSWPLAGWHLFLYCYYGLFRLFGLWLFMIVVVYLSFVSIDIIDVNLLYL